jgi:hypothetical protein
MRHATRTITLVGPTCALLLLASSRAGAHERGMSQLDLAVSGARVDGHAIFAVEDRVDPEHFFDKQLELTVDGAACTPHVDRTATEGKDFDVWVTLRCPREPGHIAATVYDLRPEDRVVASLHTGDRLTQAVLTSEKRQLSLTVPRPSSSRPSNTWLAALALSVTLIVVTLLLRRRRSSDRV